MTHLSLFSGIGGLDLAAEMAGFTTVGQCEWADYPTKVLERHWPDVPLWRDIRTLTKESFYERTGLRTVDVISGGFPCQPFSVAGKQRGKADDRFLWPEMRRVIEELQPSWVLGENVPGIVNLALDEVLFDLESIGYSTQAFIIPACGVDAPHKRERVAILAYSVNRGGSVRRDWQFQNTSQNGGKGAYLGGRTETAIPGKRREDKSRSSGMADGIRTGIYNASPNADSDRLQGRNNEQMVSGEQCQKNIIGGGCTSQYLCRTSERVSRVHSAWENWPCEPDIPRVVDGLPDRVDRIKCLGNAVVPQQFYIFFKLIADLENSSS